MTDLIHAPWTPEQVAALNAFQERGGMHPFTCGNEHATPALHLVAHEDGWHCWLPDCDYRQDWAHAFMADPVRWPKPWQRFTARPVTPEMEQAAMARVRETEEARARSAAWFAEHSGPRVADDVPAEQPARTTPDNSAASSDPADNPLRDRLAGALYERERPPREPVWADAYAMDREVFEAMADTVLTELAREQRVGPNPVGTVDNPVTPSRRAGLHADIVTALGQIPTTPPVAHRRAQADNVLVLLYREWPWLRAEAEDAWTPPPPGSTREQLPDHLLALIDIPPYTSTACETAGLLAAAIVRHPEHADELRQWESRQRQRCRINNKYTGVHCQHTAPEPAATEATDRSDLALSLYYAQDALDLVAERCDLADQKGHQPTTAEVRQWLKGARCARQHAAEQAERTTVNNPPTTPAP